MEQTTLHEPPIEHFYFIFFSTQKLENIAKNGNHIKSGTKTNPHQFVIIFFLFRCCFSLLKNKKKENKIQTRL